MSLFTEESTTGNIGLIVGLVCALLVVVVLLVVVILLRKIRTDTNRNKGIGY